MVIHELQPFYLDLTDAGEKAYDVEAEAECADGNEWMFENEDKDPRGHAAHEFRSENFSKAKRAKLRKLNKLAKKARRK